MKNQLFELDPITHKPVLNKDRREGIIREMWETLADDKLCLYYDPYNDLIYIYDNAGLKEALIPYEFMERFIDDGFFDLTEITENFIEINRSNLKN